MTITKEGERARLRTIIGGPLASDPDIEATVDRMVNIIMVATEIVNAWPEGTPDAHLVATVMAALFIKRASKDPSKAAMSMWAIFSRVMKTPEIT